MSFIWLASVFFTSVFSLWCQGVNCTPLFGILWPPDVERQLIGKDHDAGKDWGQEEKGMTGWDGWMASPTWWTWVWVNSESWWWTGWPGMLRFMGSQRVRHYWVTELNWTDLVNLIMFASIHWPCNTTTATTTESEDKKGSKFWLPHWMFHFPHWKWN